jgi:hypothetical protein
MKNFLLVLFALMCLFNSCTKTDFGEVSNLQDVSTLSATVTATTFNNEPSTDSDGLTRPRPFPGVPSSLNRTLWGTYDSDWQSFDAVAGKTYTVTVSNYDVNNSQVNRFRIEVWRGISPNSVFLYRTADGTFSTQFTATQSTKYLINVGDQNSDLNTGSSLGDYTITLTTDGSQPPVVTAVLTTLSLNPSTVIGGTASTGTVTLSAPAPVGGLAVALSSTNAVARVSSAVIVPAGSTSQQFSIATTATSRKITATIGASLAGVTRTQILTVNRR